MITMDLLERIYKKFRIIRHRLTGFIRVLPDFLIIGVPRGGTTSLYNYMIEHPNIIPALSKEIGFFSEHYDKGITWYKSHFPSKLLNKYMSWKKINFFTGEASPIYLYHPLAPKRILETIPNVKMILLLRNPVERAWSHYWQSVRKYREKLSFEEVIKRQMNEEHLSDYDAFCTELYHTNNDQILNQYISGSIYLERLKRFYDIFPKEKILILASEDLYNNPQMICDEISEFLKIPKWNLKKFTKYNYYVKQPKLDERLKRQLLEYFKPHNEQLYKYLNRDFGWDKQI